MKGTKGREETWFKYSLKEFCCSSSCNTKNPLASKFRSLPTHVNYIGIFF